MQKVNRWFYAALGVTVLFFAGMIYAWSTLAGPIGAEFPQWTKAQLSLTFTITMIAFCLGCMAGGFFADRVAPRLYLWTAAALFLAGFALTANIRSLGMLYAGFGVVAGFGSGLAYNAVMGTVTKWFPDRQGLISGVLLMGFGISAFAVGKLYQALTPQAIGAWRSSFYVMGALTAGVLAVCGAFLKGPAANFAPPAPPVQKAAGGPARFAAPQIKTAQMLRRPAFWLYYAWAVLLSAAGLALISQASGAAAEVSGNVSAGTIATAVGLISVANAAGRVLFGLLYDKAGRRATMQLVNAAFAMAACVLLAARATGSFAVLVLGFLMGGFAYGGVTPTNAAFVSTYFGQEHFAMNFSVINTNLIFASFGSAVAGSLYDAARSYTSVYVLMLCLAGVGVLASLGISLCDARTRRR